MLIRLNVIDREGKKTVIDIEESTTIRDAIEKKLSPDNYSNFLVELNSQVMANNLIFGAKNVKHSAAGQAARDALVAKGWTITDGGLA